MATRARDAGRPFAGGAPAARTAAFDGRPVGRSSLRSYRGLWLVVPLSIAAVLQFADLGGKSLWDDEVTTVTIATQGSLEDVYTAYRASERQPPLHYLVLHGWTRVAGASDLAVRVPSALFSVASVLLVAWLGLRVAGRRVGFLAAYLLAISPFLLLFGPMARYYSQALFLVLLSTALLLEALHRPQRWGRTRAMWILYVVASIAMLLTSYTNAAYFVAQIVFAALLVSRRPQPSTQSAIGEQRQDAEPVDIGLLRRRTAVSQAAVVGVFAIWVAVDFNRLVDFASSDRQFAIGGVKETALAAIYPFYAWTLGETIFPWHPAAIVALAIFMPAAALGLVRLATGSPSHRVPVIALVTGLLLMLVSFQFFVRDLPFETLASRGIAGMPFLLLLVAAGLEWLPLGWRVAALVALTAAVGVSGLHYFQGRQFHNATYALPTKEVVATVRELAHASDLIVSDPDLPFHYYYRAGPSSPRLFSATESRAAQQALSDGDHDRVWLVTAGRDSTRGWRVKWGATQLEAWMKQHFRLQRTWQYVPQDALYARIKARMQGYPSYRYKLMLRLYVRHAS
ncbi:MAG: glycosyltransferase family 39 protein [Actinomycetota bacterium]|nr:glycosyltransferase family 39 protein [Actinomycetota bacterium]